MFGKKTIGIVLLVCFLWTCFFAFPSFGESTPSQEDSLGLELQNDPINPINEDDTLNESNNTESDTNSQDAAVSDPAASNDDAATAPDIADDTDSSTNAAVDVTVPTTPKAIDTGKKDEEGLWYCSRIPMKKEHQKLLWEYCKKRSIDYVDMLALISLESNFYEKCSSGRYKGYFQISSKHGSNLAATLKTANKPLDGAININWGTAMYSWILADKRVKGLDGKKLRDAALSIYQRGTGGYDKYGINKKFLAQYYKKWNIIVSYFEQK